MLHLNLSPLEQQVQATIAYIERLRARVAELEEEVEALHGELQDMREERDEAERALNRDS